MSNIQANNPPEPVSRQDEGSESEEPEPSPAAEPPEPIEASDHGPLSVPIDWDEEIPALAGLTSGDITRAVRTAAATRGYHDGEIGVRVTTDPEIHRVNREFLSHDYPTDVISFPYEADAPRVHGELIVSLDTARRSADQVGWSTENELRLYLVHGTLHLVGLDDHSPADRDAMRSAECEVFAELGIDLRPYSVDEEGAQR